jgi:hypothetical protein
MTLTATQVKLEGEALKLIKHEAELTSTPMSKILRDYAVEYIKLKNDSLAARKSSLIHCLIAGMESRIAISLEENLKAHNEVNSKLEVLSTILDSYIKLYLNHTPEVPLEQKAERVRATLPRYQRFLNGVKNAFVHDNIISQIQELVFKEHEKPSE